MTAIGIASDQNKVATQPATVFIVDDDADVRRTISILARSVDLGVELFSNAQDFLDSYTTDQPGCLVLDVRMPGLTGLELQQKLNEKDCRIPTILLTAHAEVPMATRAMRAGAIDFIQKPYSPQMLLERIHEAIHFDADARCEQSHRAMVHELIATLSPREKGVMKLLAHGHSTKKIAHQLEISVKTVDNHRASILQKMKVDNVPELVRLVIQFVD